MPHFDTLLLIPELRISPSRKSTRMVCFSFTRQFRHHLLWIIVVLTPLAAIGQPEEASTPVAAESPPKESQTPRQPRTSRSGSSAAVPPKISRYATYLISRHDHNKDGVLQTTEWQELQGRPDLIDANGDGLIDRDELIGWVIDYGRRKRIGVQWGRCEVCIGLQSKRKSVSVIGRDADADVAEPSLNERRRNLKFFVPANRLPQGLPEWFITKDTDGDGQLTAGEFSPPASCGAGRFRQSGCQW